MEDLYYLKFVSAFLILITWIVYLRNIDIYEKEKWSYTLLTVVFGIIGVFILIPVYSFVNQVLAFNFNNTPLNDFIYCIFGIGLLEETIKIVPLVLILYFSEEVNEPIDYIYYASLSALGYSFIENINYFDFNHLGFIHVRAIISTSLHMIFSSIIAFAFVMNKYVWKKYNNYLLFSVALLISSSLHGLFYYFNLFLIEELYFLTYILFFPMVYLWNKMVSDCISNSSFYDINLDTNYQKASRNLMFSLAGIFILEYVFIGFYVDFDELLFQIERNLRFEFNIIFYIFAYFTSFAIIRNKWFLVEEPYQEIMHIDINQIVGLKIDIQSFQQPSYALAYFPNQGEIKSKLINSRWNDLFLLELTNLYENDEFNADYIAIRLNENADGLFFGNKQIIKLFLIDKNYDLESSFDTFQYVKYCGTIVAQKIKENSEIIEE